MVCGIGGQAPQSGVEVGGVFGVLDRISGGVHISCMAKAKKSKAPTPRKQHPFLVGCTEEEAALISRGAAKFEMGPTTFLRDCGLFQAREALGLKQPKVEG